MGLSHLVVGSDSRGGGMKGSAGRKQKRGCTVGSVTECDRWNVFKGRAEKAGWGLTLPESAGQLALGWEAVGGTQWWSSWTYAHFRDSTGGSVKTVARWPVAGRTGWGGLWRPRCEDTAVGTQGEDGDEWYAEREVMVLVNLCKHCRGGRFRCVAWCQVLELGEWVPLATGGAVGVCWRLASTCFTPAATLTFIWSSVPPSSALSPAGGALGTCEEWNPAHYTSGQRWLVQWTACDLSQSTCVPGGLRGRFWETNESSTCLVCLFFSAC